MVFLSSLVALVPPRLPIAAAALAVAGAAGLVTGPILHNACPFFWIVTDRLFGGLGNRLDRLERAPRDLIMRGFFLTAFAITLFALAGFSAYHAEAYIPYRLGDVLFLSLALSAGAVWRFVAGLYRVLKTKKGSYLTLSRSTRTDFSAIDDFAMTRAAITYAARSFDKAIVTPLVWYLIGGLPITYIYAGLAALCWHFSRDGHGKGFGALPQGIEAILGTIPNALSGIFLALAALLTPKANIIRAFAGLLRLRGRVPYAEGGPPVTAMAFALKISLGGPATDLEGRTIKHRWFGPANASARLDHVYLLRALYLSVVAYLLVLAALTAGWYLLSQGSVPALPAVAPHRG